MASGIEGGPRPGPVRIGIIGAGGIGANLMRQLAQALAMNPVVERVGGVSVSIYDSDVVDAGNLRHQPFTQSDVGRTKVSALVDSIRGLQSGLLGFHAGGFDVRCPADLDGYDIVVACVDSPPARVATHTRGGRWLDLRCRGDAFLALDHRMGGGLVESMTDPSQGPGSCQFEGAVESGNIQFGHLWAAAHGCQWVIQCLRQIAGEDGAMLPYPKSESMTFGTLERFPLAEEGG
jgi:hypothetical protein